MLDLMHQSPARGRWIGFSNFWFVLTLEK